MAMRQALDGMDQSEGSGLTVVETKRLAAGGEHKGEGNEAGEGAGGGSGNGSGSGSGAGSGAEHGAGAGQQNSVENQVNAHQHEESFVIVLGSDEHQVEWLTHKIVANDGAQIIGRIPLYSVHEVISEIVENFLLVFLMIIFGCSLLFAYFFLSGYFPTDYFIKSAFPGNG